jgi:predicted alpha/beta superfamily hydrolase
MLFTALASVTSSGGDGPVVRVLGGDQFEVIFAFEGAPETESVHLAGTFNGWDRTACKLEGPDANRRFARKLVLDRGVYEYKFIVNGRDWVPDPTNVRVVGPHHNSVLWVGLQPTADETAARVARPVEMAGLVPHPPMMGVLTHALSEAGGSDAAVVKRWFAQHPQPLFADQSVSIICYAPNADSVHLLTSGRGFAHGYDMPRLVKGSSVFAITLKRADLRERMSYRFEVERAGETYTEDDPHAWTMTQQAGQAGALLAEPDAKTGRVRLVRDLKDSAGVLRDRDLWVYLPPGYAEGTQRYPVLYVHDGQNLWGDTVEPFGHGGWRLNEVADRLISGGHVRAFIAVGVANTADRLEEYGVMNQFSSPDAHPYLRFLKLDAKRYVDAHYCTKTGPTDTAQMGSSMGGVISFQAALLDPDTWGSAACMSPAFWYPNECGTTCFDLLAAKGRVPVRLYIDHGTAGSHQDGAPSTRKMVELLTEAGWKPGVDLMHFEAEGAEHNERAWARRVHRPLVFLFGK